MHKNMIQSVTASSVSGTSVDSDQFLEEISQYIFTSKYARFNEYAERRETWNECVDRVESMHLSKFRKLLSKEDIAAIKECFEQVKQKRVVPSMRSMQFGGKAVAAHNARIFNCCVRHIDTTRAFAEVFYLLLCGCGVGLGVSKHFIGRLPDLVNKEDKSGSVITYLIQDSIEGWADSIEALLNCYFRNTAYSGRKIVFDYSKIRPEGAIIHTGGGKAPGYRGLKRTHQRIKQLLDYIIEDKHQTRLYPINAYDILMHCADAVLSGGIRRSATSAIFDNTDDEMFNAKVNFHVSRYAHFTQNEHTSKWEGVVYVDSPYGGMKGHKYEVVLSAYEYETMVKKNKVISWTHIEPQRARSNNSVLLLKKDVTLEQIKKISFHTRQYGEPGIVFADHPWQLFNPCYEIGFLPVTDDGICGVQFCNLTSTNGAKVTTPEEFYSAIISATVIGTLQAAYTDFKYLSHVAKYLTCRDALLGVSITGMMDNPHILLDPEIQQKGAQLAKDINKLWAEKLQINPAARITCIKPEGCLAPETRIKTSRGTKTLAEIFNINGYDLEDFKNQSRVFLPCIEKIQVRDSNDNWQYIKQLYVNGVASDVFEVEFVDNTIVTCTPNHKFLTGHDTWKMASELAEGDGILSFPINAVKQIKKITKKHNQFTVDIEVANTHSYQLDNGCVTHNTSSLVLQSASGIHPHHARKYFRRVQCNKHDPVYVHFKKTNPHMCEESVWSANKTDDVITFPVKIAPAAIVKADLTAIDHLEKIKSTQINWVLPGSNSTSPITHNVSCTVIVDESEWDDVFTYLYKNREYFAAVAFLPKSGDKIYRQAPNEAVVTIEDEAKWRDIVDNYKPVNYKMLIERTDNTSLMDTVACGGGACELDPGSTAPTITG